jgi:hypothetical protein
MQFPNGKKYVLQVARVNHRPTKKTGPEIEFVFKVVEEGKPATPAPGGKAKGSAPKAKATAASKSATTTSASPARTETTEALATRLALLVLQASSVSDLDATQKSALDKVLPMLEAELVALKNTNYASGLKSGRAIGK